MKRNLLLTLTSLAATTMFTACVNEAIETRVKSLEQVNDEYFAAFKSEIGDSKLNSVKYVNVDAAIPEGTGTYTLRVYDGYPAESSGAQMLGKFENLEPGSFVNVGVNCPDNAEHLFFTVEQNGLSKVTNCAITSTNKAVARFAGPQKAKSYTQSIMGTFDLYKEIGDVTYGQFSYDFYQRVPDALLTFKGIFNERNNHYDASVEEATFSFNSAGEIVFYPIYMNGDSPNEVGYEILDKTTNQPIKDGTGVFFYNMQDVSEANNFLWLGDATGPNRAFPRLKLQSEGQQVNEGDYSYCKPFTVRVPDSYTGDISNLYVVLYITSTNTKINGTQYKYYSVSSMNNHPGDSKPNRKMVAYATGKVELEPVSMYNGTQLQTTRTFGLVGFEDLIQNTSDLDFNDIIFYTEADHITTHNYENKSRYYIGFEDLGGECDFDFNDVVLELEYVSGQTNTTVRCVAAGGTLPVEVFFDGDKYVEPVVVNPISAPTRNGIPTGAVSLWGNVHTAFGESNDVVINTIPAGMQIENLKSAIRTPLSASITLSESFNIAEDALPFYLMVSNRDLGQVKIDPVRQDGTPQAIVLSTTWLYDSENQKDYTQPAFTQWRWPIEKTRITDAYPDITKWFQDANYYDWMKKGVNEKIFNDAIPGMQ